MNTTSPKRTAPAWSAPARRRPGRGILAAAAALTGFAVLLSACGTGSTGTSSGEPAHGANPLPGGEWRAFGGWLSQRAAAGQFSGAALVAEDGKLILDAGYGLADRTAGIPNTPQTKFGIASIGKLFTAVAIA